MISIEFVLHFQHPHEIMIETEGSAGPCNNALGIIFSGLERHFEWRRKGPMPTIGLACRSSLPAARL